MVTRRAVLGSATAGIGLFSGCTNILGEIDGGEKTVVDMANREVSVPNTVESLVGVGPGGLRLLSHLELTDRVSAVETAEKEQYEGEIPYNIANENEFQSKPPAGSRGGDVEYIVQSDPDVIVATTTENAKTLQQQTEIPTVYVDQGEFTGENPLIYTAWEIIGKITGKSDRATELIEYVDQIRDDLNHRVKEENDHSDVYIGAVSHRGARGIQATEIPHPVLEMINASTAVSVESQGKVDIDREVIIDADPEFMFFDRSNAENIQDDLDDGAYDSITAIEQGQWYWIHPEYHYQYNLSTILSNAYFIGKKLYPAAFTDVEIAEKGDEIYRKMLGAKVLESLEATVGRYGEIRL